MDPEKPSSNMPLRRDDGTSDAVGPKQTVKWGCCPPWWGCQAARQLLLELTSKYMSSPINEPVSVTTQPDSRAYIPELAPTNQICFRNAFPIFPTAFEQAPHSRWVSLPTVQKLQTLFIFQTLCRIPNTYSSINNSLRKPHVPFTQMQRWSTHITPMAGTVLKHIQDIPCHPQVCQYHTTQFLFAHLCSDISLLPPSHLQILSHPARLSLGLTSYTVSTELVT